MRRVAVFGVVLVAIVVASLWWPTQIASPSPIEPAAPTTDGPGPAPAAAATATAPVEPVVDANSQRTEAPAPVPTPIALGPEFVLRGRCVDERGQPVAGVAAKLTGWGANSERMNTWRKDHDEPKRSDAKVTTGDNGVFEFHFWPPPPFQFALVLAKPAYATKNGRWSKLEPGGNKDLGDIVMTRGTLLGGRVVDSNGTLVANVEVHFGQPQGDMGEIGARTSDIGYVRGQDGTFAGRTPLPPGSYAVDVPHRSVKSPKTVVLDGSASEQFVDVVLQALDDSKAIAGIVVDEREQPVRGVMVNTVPGVGGQHWIISTDPDGRFLVQKSEQGGAEAVQLMFQLDGYEHLVTEERFAWGRSDLRITLRKGLDVEVLVVAATDGTPIEDYQLRVIPQTSSYRSSDDIKARGSGHHDGGRLTIRGICRGEHVVLVEPKGDGWARSGLVPLTVAEPGPLQLTVRLTANALRELRVRYADGSPVANARVQLADPGRVEVTPQLRAMPLEQWAWNSSQGALELAVATTDAEGKAQLHGPGDHALALLLPGPPNAPIAVADVHLDVAEPLIVTVSTGARLEGSVHPPESLAELRLGGEPPSIQLVRGEGAQVEYFPPRFQPATIADDGAFVLEGVPAGAWTVQLCWWQATGGGTRMSDSQPAGVVALQDGATAHLDIDASFITPGELDGTVFHNGAPLANTNVTVNVSFGKDARGYDTARGLAVTTDAEGRFHFRSRAGDCTVSLQGQPGDHYWMLTAPEHIFVVAGRTVAQAFHVQSGTVRVRLLDVAGQPVAAVTIELRDAAGTCRQHLPATDADGWTSAEIEAEPFTAAVLPRRLQDPKAQVEVWRNNPGNPDPLATVRIALGEVRVTVGETKEFELRLPAGW